MRKQKEEVKKQKEEIKNQKEEVKKHHKEETPGIFKGVFMAYFIVILHVLLIAGVGTLVLFFKGVTDYMIWILIGSILLILLTGFYFYNRVSSEGRNLGQTLNSPMFNGRNVEISFLGGLASLKVGMQNNSTNILPMGNPNIQQPLQIEDSASMRIRKLTELAYLLERNLITREEYNQTKQQIFNS